MFSSLKFEKDLGENSDLESEVEKSINDPIDDGKVDLGSDDDYIYVDHSNDEVSEDIEEPTIPDINDYVSKDEDYSVDEQPVFEETQQDEVPKQQNIKKPVFSDKINIENDEDYREEKVDLGFENINEDKEDSSSENVVDDDKVDLGSDDDYIYVDHSNDEVTEETENFQDDSGEANFEDKPQEVQVQNKSKRPSFVKSIISEVVNGESKLEPEEIEIVHGEIMEEDDVPLHKPAPKDEDVVEAEIVNGHDFSSEEILEKPTPKSDYFEEDEELNIFTDELPDLSHDEYEEIHDEATNVIGRAMDEFMNGIYEDGDLDIQDEGSFEQSIQDKFVDEEIIKDANADVQDMQDASEDINVSDRFDDKIVEDAHVDVQDMEETPENDNADEEVIYFKGATDVTNPLRKNNVYYKNEQKKSIKDSIKGIKKDMQYINKSLNEIENPTQIDYVSVVDRTEEYDPNDYLSRPSDDDSDRIIQMEEESIEKENQRMESELIDDPFEREIPQNDDVIVTVNNPHVREELKDQALEDIIQTADEDYKEIEKERFQNANKLKAFDDQKLPGKRKLEDEIIDYVQADDIGLTPQNDLYAQPIPKVAQSVKRIVDIEGPIHVKEVTTRIKDSCNIKRAGSNLKKTVNLAINEAESSGDIIKIGDFLYDASNNNVVIRKRNKPNIDLISDEEIAKSIELVLIHKQNISTNQIAKEASRNFGFKSTSKKTASRINGVLDLMIANNRVKIVNDYVELN